MFKLIALKRRFRETFGLWRKVFWLLSYSGKWLGFAVLGLTLAEIAFSIGSLLMIKSLAETMIAAEDLRAQSDTFLWYILLLLLVFLAGRIAAALGNYVRSKQGYVVTDYVNRAIQERAVKADLSFYDSAEYYDSLQGARQAGAGRPAQVVANTLNVLRSMLMLGSIMIVIATVEWLVLPICFAAVVLILVVQIYFTRERFQLQRQLVPKERRALYADFLMTSEPYAKEIRLWDLGSYLRKVYIQQRKLIREDYNVIEWRKALSESCVALISALLLSTVIAYLLYRFSAGAATLSDLVIVVLLLLRAELSGRNFVAALSRLYDDQLYLSQIFGFLDLKARIESSAGALPVPTNIWNGIQMKGVCFTYPGADEPTLHDVSLDIKPGRFTALVGGNGSGKTTLIKLLCRLYDPEKGQILLDGADVRGFATKSYRRLFSVIFQDFVQFAFSGAVNVQLADLGHKPDFDRMRKATKLSGADEVLEELPQGYDTLLSRMFDGGVELSGGQWQKVALARAVFPDSRFLILDEPTSAIDPNAEAALFEGFRSKLGGRGALVISHRLSTIRMADYTYVLDKGRIVEEGTHDELIARGGRYAQMFERQGRGYRR